MWLWVFMAVIWTLIVGGETQAYVFKSLNAAKWLINIVKSL